MHRYFEYGGGRIKDLGVQVAPEPDKPELRVRVNGEPCKPSDRFWTSLQVRFGFSSNIFTYFTHQEVFDRISEVSANDRIRWCIERDDGGQARLLAVTNPKAPLMPYDDLRGLLRRYDLAEASYHDGVVTTMHSPRLGGGTFSICGDGFQNRYLMQTPIDGYGKPSVYLSLLRLVCANGAVARTPVFRSELSLGRGGTGADYALVRALEGFNNEEGYAALRQRFESATKSWASVHEANKLYRALVRIHHDRGLLDGRAAVGGDGAREPVLPAFHRLTGDVSRIYGLANLDALSVKRQRTLPVACKVYDLLNFTSEVATHHATEPGRRRLQAYIGDLIGTEYDLEGSTEQFTEWKDFFIGNEATTETLAGLQCR
jgi:hypothetical protein